MIGEVLKGEKLKDGKTGVLWTHNEKPCANHWYKLRDADDYWKFTKDYHSELEHVTYYKIVEYYNGDNIYVGRTLAQIRELIRDNTYRMVI